VPSDGFAAAATVQGLALEASKRSDTMARGFIHTVPVGGGLWRNRVESMELLRGAYVRKDDAIAAGRREARRRKTEHVVHNWDGTIAERTSYESELARDPRQGSRPTSMLPHNRTSIARP
jgi:hypothetical protein